MATASPPSPAPAVSRDTPGARLRRVLPPLAVILGVPALVALTYGWTYLNFDARYALLWARDIVHGHTPDYTGAFAPTPHPLQTFVAGLTLPFGDVAAGKLMALIVLLSFGVLVWLVYRLGSELHSPAVGVLAAVVVATRPNLGRFALVGYQDIPFAMLIVLALVLEVRRPKRGPLVLGVLALAGLMRPDAWVLSFAYVAYVWSGSSPRRRVELLALAALAPVLWMVQDAIVTGQPLHSLKGTKELAGEVNRRRPPEQVPSRTLWYLKLLLLWPLAFGVPLGLVYWWRRERRRWAPVVATAAILVGFILFAALVGLSLIQRYMITPAVLLTLVYGLGVFGWLKLPSGEARDRWRALGVAALALSVIWIPWHVSNISHLATRLDHEHTNYTDLRLALRQPVVRDRFAQCGGTISVLGHKPVPDVRWWLEGRPGSVKIVEGRVRRVGPLLLAPRPTKQMWTLYRKVFARVAPPAGYRPLFRNHSWIVYSTAGCGSGRLSAPPGGDSPDL
jgi:hypothetical protein